MWKENEYDGGERRRITQGVTEKEKDYNKNHEGVKRGVRRIKGRGKNEDYRNSNVRVSIIRVPNKEWVILDHSTPNEFGAQTLP